MWIQKKNVIEFLVPIKRDHMLQVDDCFVNNSRPANWFWITPGKLLRILSPVFSLGEVKVTHAGRLPLRGNQTDGCWLQTTNRKSRNPVPFMLHQKTGKIIQTIPTKKPKRNLIWKKVKQHLGFYWVSAIGTECKK